MSSRRGRAMPRKHAAALFVVCALAPVLAGAPASAEPRPTEGGGPWTFDPSDELAHWDEPTGTVRVHYSLAGPNATRLDDADGDSVPDFPQGVALTTAAALTGFTEELGLRAPVPEAELGLELGGSPALDVYLVDFAGAADGRFGVDDCTPGPLRCAGFLVIENDFAGYGYGSLAEAVDVVASHEGFHAVQAAYGALPIWMSEGTAVWAERWYAPQWPDFLRWCDAYLLDPGRPLDQPPLGPVPGFAYGTALWWDFLSVRHDPEVIGEVLAGMETRGGTEADGMTAVVAAIEARGDALAEAFGQFARWNLATGHRAGVAESHAYAAELEAVAADEEGPELDVDARVYPVSTQYWRLEHAGGPLWLGADDALPGVVVSLHAVEGGAADGAVGEALASVQVDAAGAVSLADAAELPPGGYWLVVARPAVAEGSAQARVCVGGLEHVEGCVGSIGDTGEGSTDGGSTGEGSTGGDSSEESSATGAGDSTDGADGTAGDEAGQAPDADAGCGCRASEGPGGATLLLLPLLPWILPATRRRRSRRAC